MECHGLAPQKSWSRLLGKPARLFLLLDPLDCHSFYTTHRTGMEGAAFVVARPVSRCESARTGYEPRGRRAASNVF